ncbi:MAG TPA: NDP-sugar synthase [Vicinamibacterales bacterium]|jgi:NDP-sugar pyrophosphorylase family protein
MLPTLLLTAGLGTRLRPLSYVRAKPAVPVAGEVLVRRILMWLRAAGVRDVVLNLHYEPQSITAELGDGSDLGVTLRYSWENPVLGSAGGPRRARSLLAASRFLIVNGDTLTNLDIHTLAREHERTAARVTMAVVPNPAPDRYGGVLVDEAGSVVGFVGRGSARPSWHYIGVQVVEADVFSALPPDEPAETVNALYPALIRRRPGSVRALRCDASFEDIGTPADYLATSLAIAAREGGPSRLVGRRCTVAQSARVVRSILWDDVTVEDDVTLTECAVGDGVRVPAGTALTRHSVILAGDAARHGAVTEAGSHIVGNLLVVPFGDRPGGQRQGSQRP